MNTIDDRYDNPPGCIHAVSGECLGDVWSSLNFFHKLSVKTNSVVRISCYLGRKMLYDKIMECLDILSGPGRLEIVQDRPTRKRVPFCFCFSCGYFSARHVWKKRSNSKLICYQFDASTRVRRPTNDEISDFIKRATAGGWKLENLGSKRPLKESVKLASMAYAFVGVVSGLTEVCASVRVPMHIAINDYPRPWVAHMYAGRLGRLYQRLPDINLNRLHDVGII